MRPTWCISASALALLMLSNAASAEAEPQTRSQTSPKPKIKVEEPVYNFGKVIDSAVVEHNFKITNVGQAPLQIKKVRNTCGCTAINAQPQTLEPGAATEVGIRLTVSNLNGKVSKTAYVESNDPQTLNQALTLTGEVIRAITMTPMSAVFDRLDRKNPTTIELMLTNNLSDPMTPSEVTVSVKNVVAKIDEVEKGKQYKIILTANPPYPDNHLRGKVTVKTGLAKKPEFAIDFFGRPPPPIEILPTQTIALGALNPNQEYKRTVRVVCADETPFDITEVGTTNWRFTPQVRQVREGKEFEVEITARPPYEWGSNRASINISTRSPAAPRLTVQVYGELPPPITVYPTTLLFRDLSTTKGGSAIVDVKVADSSAVEITSCRSTLANVTAQLEVREQGRSYRLMATATPPLPLGQLQGEVILETTHPRMSLVKVPIQSFPINAPLPAVSVIPDPVLTIPPAGLTTSPAVSRFIVRANGSEKVHVTNVTTSNKEIATRIEPQTGVEDRMTFVYITVPANTVLKPEGETITISTDHKEFAQVARRIVRARASGTEFRRPPISAGPAKLPGRAATPGAQR
jgi:hypothetical protein